MASGMDDPQLDTERFADDDSDLPNQYRTGPTFGERIGAKPGAMQAAPAAPAAAPAPPPIQMDASKLPPGILPSTAKVDATVPGYGQPQAPSIQLPPAKMPPGILRTNVSPGEVPSPIASSPATTVLPNLMRQRSQAAAPIDPKAVDPATGKPMYRMGWGQRLLGTVANFANGFARNGVEPTYVGPGATNPRFARDTAMQGQKVAGLDTDIGNQEKLAGLQEKGYEDALKQAYEGQLGDARIQTADAATQRAQAAGETADVKSQLAASQAELNKQRGIAAAATANKNDATRPRAIMGTRTMEKQDDGSWKDVGPAPTKQGGAGRGSKSDFDKIERDKQKQIKDAENQAQTAVMKIKPPAPTDYAEFAAYSKNPVAWKESKKQEIYAELEGKKNQAQADYEARIQEKGGKVSAPGQATVKAPPPNKVVPAKPNEPRIRVREKATGKTGTLPKSQVAQAIATGKYEQAQ